MRVPLSWLREYVDLPASISGHAVAERLVRAGLEVEAVDEVGADVSGPLVVGRVLAIDEFVASNGKTIRWCQVEVGETKPRGIVCGAVNFAEGDHVAVALPGSVLPGGFHIGARKAYGKMSDGMICSARELGLGDDHTGILVLPRHSRVGADAVELLELRDDVIDIAVTPDRGYCLSVRGVAREAATAYDVPLRDPAFVGPSAAGDGQRTGYPVRIADPVGCSRFVARTVTGIDPSAPSPMWLRRRLMLAGMRPVSLAVDVTNHVMLDVGQPLHAYDRARLSGPIVVRRATEDEKLVTLDGVTRDLATEDLLICDDTGPIGLAGVMGGASTEISDATSDVVIEAAHFDPVAIARAARRHKLPSEASRRFERTVDPDLPPAAAELAVRLLVELGGGTAEGGVTDVDNRQERPAVTMPVDLPARLGGRPYDEETVRRRLADVGCELNMADGEVRAIPPSWRPDLQMGADLVEEVLRLEGYDTIPSELPVAPPGRGLTAAQRIRRRIGQVLAGAGYVEVADYPFVGPAAWDALGFAADDPRRRTLRLANPLSDEEPELRTTLLPGLLQALQRNVGRGFTDLAIYETGLVYLPRSAGVVRAPRLGVDRRPTDAEIDALEEALPDQPHRLAVALCGMWQPAGWWGPARPVSWADAVEAARTAGRAVHREIDVRRGELAPWHPGRCAELVLDGAVIGHAGELHPRAVEALGLPPRTVAMELDVDALVRGAVEVVPAPAVSPYPVAKEDVALVVAADVPASDVQAALREGAGSLLESVRLFDVYTGEQVGEGRKSLAFALRFRAPDRTLGEGEAAAARDAAVAEAARRVGAALRGSAER
jgi:phenylalanyl-tRNA synthetase beta chain